MQITQTLKRAPKWAWYVVGGVTLGAVGIRVWKGRATDATPTTTADTAGSPDGAVSNQPSPVIVPPVIMQGDTGDKGALADMTGALAGTIGSSFDNMVNVISGLAAGDQAITSGATGSLEEISKDLIAQAGSAPKPVTQSPIGVTVRVQQPTPTPRAAPINVISSGHKCPPAFPRHDASKGKPSPKSCYRCQRNANPHPKYPWIHHYQNASTKYVKTC